MKFENVNNHLKSNAKPFTERMDECFIKTFHEMENDIGLVNLAFIILVQRRFGNFEGVVGYSDLWNRIDNRGFIRRRIILGHE